jgi:hypothetical protein
LSEPDRPRQTTRFYSDHARLYTDVGDFLAAGLSTGHAAIVIATMDHQRAFRETLEVQGIDLTSASARGQFIALDAEQTLRKFMVGGMESGLPSGSAFRRFALELMQAVSSRYPRIRAYGEMGGLLRRHGNEMASVRLQQLWNEMSGRLKFDIYTIYQLGNQDRPGLVFEEAPSGQRR